MREPGNGGSQQRERKSKVDKGYLSPGHNVKKVNEGHMEAR